MNDRFTKISTSAISVVVLSVVRAFVFLFDLAAAADFVLAVTFAMGAVGP